MFPLSPHLDLVILPLQIRGLYPGLCVACGEESSFKNLERKKTCDLKLCHPNYSILLTSTINPAFGDMYPNIETQVWVSLSLDCGRHII
jgi:hypothetical protein